MRHTFIDKVTTTIDERIRLERERTKKPLHSRVGFLIVMVAENERMIHARISKPRANIDRHSIVLALISVCFLLARMQTTRSR